MKTMTVPAFAMIPQVTGSTPAARWNTINNPEHERYRKRTPYAFKL
jgi:hypothetical protein